jgi:hypothetical protein
MKRILWICSVALLIFSCRNKAKPTDDTTHLDENHKELYGFWVGDFLPEFDYVGGGNEQPTKINIIIKKIAKDRVIAQSVVAGKKHSLEGSLIENEGKLKFIMKGLDQLKGGGSYEFELKGDTLIGVWSNLKAGKDAEKMYYKLLKREFVYNPNLMLPKVDYIDWADLRPKTILDTLDDGSIDTNIVNLARSASPLIFEVNASKDLLKPDDLKNLRKLDLQIIKNTIFARHGYFFKKSNIRDFFDPVDWYIPISDDVNKDLTVTERANIKLLQRYEKYAEDNYDAFGR